MIILMTDVVKYKQFDIITCVNNRDSPFHLAKTLAMGIALRKKNPFKDFLSDHNQKAIPQISNKSILIVDDVIYKGTTMKLALDACSKQRPLKIDFLAFGKSQRYAY